MDGYDQGGTDTVLEPFDGEALACDCCVECENVGETKAGRADSTTVSLHCEGEGIRTGVEEHGVILARCVVALDGA